MSEILKRVEEYMVETSKKDTYWLVFNTAYNDIFAFDIEPELKSSDGILAMYEVCLNKKFVDNEARDEFLQFIQTKFPNTKLIEVLDLIGASYKNCPYLGSIAVDCEKDDELFIALSEKYGKPVLVDYNKDDELSINLSENYKGTILNNAVFFELNYENALKFYNEKKEAWVDYDYSRNR